MIQKTEDLKIYRELSNGVKVIIEKDETVQSVFVKARYGVGGLDEKKGEEGISHFLEHLAFKGTSKKSALQITQEVENLGGSINAATGFNMTYYYIKTLKEDFSRGVNLLYEILTDSIFPKEEIEKEREVIKQEFLMGKDNSMRQIAEFHYKSVYPKSRMALPLIGTLKNIQSFTREQIVSYFKKYYTADRLIISVTGNIDVEKTYKEIEELFSNMTPSSNYQRKIPKYSPKLEYSKKVKKSLNQIYYWLSWESVGLKDLKSTTLLKIFSNVISFGMSSRLFTEIREKRNLVYSIWATLYSYEDFGVFLIGGSTTKDKIEKLEVEIDYLIQSLITTNPITEEEFNIAKHQFKAGLLLEMETIESKSDIAVSDIVLFNKFILIEDYIKQIDSITLKEMNDFIKDNIIDVKPAKIFYGNF